MRGSSNGFREQFCYQIIIIIIVLQSLMRKNWSKNEDGVLKKIVGEVGLNDWTAVANRLKLRYQEIHRTGKQCRERWYNHLDPGVNKEVWTYEEQLLLFESHRELGNRWKEISLRLKGRTDNNIKNHFYSTLRRSLRRLNKTIGEKNSTLHMREIKPSVLTIILNFIYDHQEATDQNGGQFINEIKHLPRLIFEFAQFKPVKGNMDSSKKETNRKHIETIFNLVEQFKESYFNEKNDKRKGDYPLSHDSVRLEDFMQMEMEGKTEEKKESVLASHSKLQESNAHTVSASGKWESGEKERGNENVKVHFEGEGHFQMMELEEPSPITYLQEQNNFPELVVIGRHWSPKKVEMDNQQLNIDEILQINYE